MNNNNNNTINQALDILCQFRGDLVPERYYTESQTGTVANRGVGFVPVDVYIALLEGLLDDGAEDRVTVTPVSTGDALEIWREACDADGASYDTPDVDEWTMIQIRECESIVTELIVPANGWY
jgi:hypothetical protein